MSKFELIEDCTAQRTAVVVLGAGGSATSAVGNVFVDLGCDAPASEGRGSSKIADLNNAVLKSAAIEPNDWSAFNRNWLSSPKATEFLNRALELLKSEFGGSYLSVIQEASTARLLPFWNVVFDRSGIVPRYLCIVSDPAELAEYLHQQLKIDHRSGHLIWLRAMLEVEANSRGSMRVFAHTEQLGEDPAASVMSVAKSLKLTFPRDINTTFATRKFRLKSYRQQIRSASVEPETFVPVTADWVTAAHQILKEWSLGGETAEGRRILDTIREAFDSAARAFPSVSRTGASGRDLAKGDEDRSQALEKAEEELRARYSEIVTLTRMLASETAAAKKYERNANRLGAIALAFERGASGRGHARWLDWILPWHWQRSRILRIIERDGLFDPSAYLAANRDVKEAGVDPLRHYLNHGAMEGRPLGCE